jgi:arabinogalactan oligomer/maltooligosaccharide transport system permease protein
MATEKHSMSMSKKRTIVNTVSYIVLGLISIIWILPFIFLVLQSFRCENTGIVNYVFPQKFGFDNYIYLFSAETNFLQWYFNTFIIALFVCVLQTIMQFMMSYTLSRFRFKLRKPLMNVMLVLGMFPGFLTMIVLYQVLKTIGLTGDNAVPGLILVSVASSGMGYYVSKGFLDTLPKSLDEAATVDGATKLQIFYKVILPLCKPILIYTVLTSFMGPWGDYIFASVIAIGSETGLNVAAGLYTWLGAAMISDNFTHFCAGGVIVAIPVMVLFMFLQKYYVEGVTGGAVKG